MAPLLETLSRCAFVWCRERMRRRVLATSRTMQGGAGGVAVAESPPLDPMFPGEDTQSTPFGVRPRKPEGIRSCRCPRLCGEDGSVKAM